MGGSDVCKLRAHVFWQDKSDSDQRFENYANHRDKTDLSEFDKLVILIPSIYKVRDETKTYSLVIIDEIESVMEEIFSKICRLKSEEIWKSFKHILDGAEKNVCLYGFLSDLNISFSVQICSNIKEMLLIKSTYIILVVFFGKWAPQENLLKQRLMVEIQDILSRG